MGGIFISFFILGRGLIVGEVGVPRFIFVAIGEVGFLDICRKGYKFVGRDQIGGERSGGGSLFWI